MMENISIVRLSLNDREQFILDNQEAFNYGALEEFGLRDNHFEEDGQIISRDTIEHSIDGGEAYRIILDDKKVGGIVVNVNGERGELDLLFVSTHAQDRRRHRVSRSWFRALRWRDHESGGAGGAQCVDGLRKLCPVSAYVGV